MDKLIAEGFEGDKEREARFLVLAKAIEAYEDSIPIMPLPVPPPKNLVDILEHKMYEQRMKQRDLARILNVSEARLSDVLSGKRKPNLDLAKRIHLRLGVDAETVLRLA
ncbi:helix-turn-helix domain-containing protein [Rudanella lutea]|uniref:helix-turn-helix domain-containing protein n=1 Tax=Rudanella lutea TaxID=451374 RepID=UPI00039B23FC|nr:helix-turn-helix domain-containing protein [Rudanella lutea]